RGGQRAKLSTRIDGTWDKTVALVENGGNDGVSGSVGRMASEEYYDTRYRIGIISDSPPTLSVGLKACGLTKGGVKAFAAVVTNNF
uniref:hypothetical protein n=1 Tax=uncultured Marinobacter sp. TaxID=187379 RepID=UPI002598062B